MSFYLGSEPVPQAILRKESTTLTAGQTVISTGGYSDGDLIQVSLNGVILEGSGVDYTASNGSDITLTVAGSAGDVLQFQTFDAFELVGSKFSAPTITNDVTLKNDTEEDTDGGRSSKLVYKGEQSGGEISTLAEIEASHDGTADDQKGDLIFRTNDGSDGASPTEAARIDSSQNLLVGKTSSSLATDGIEAKANGSLFVTRSSATPVSFRRSTDDGEIVNFYKDGTTVGSIAVDNGDNVSFGGSAANHGGLYFGSTNMAPMSGGTRSDNTIDIGTTVHRIQDIYLGGGAYIGGTGSSNHLQDYEKGTWTPVAAGSSGTAFTYSEQQGHYIKIGDMVTAWYNLTNITGSMTGHLRVGGLPFAANWMSGFNGEGVGTAALNTFTNIEGKYIYCLINDASSNIYFYHSENTNNDPDLIEAQHKAGSGADVRGFVTYYVGG